MHASHRWKHGDPPPEIRPHTLAKHRLYGEYLKRYVATVTKNPKMEKLTFTVIDGLAGGNIYTDKETGELRQGSPSIILDSLAAADRLAQERRTKPFTFDDHYIFIESDSEHFASLRATLADSGHSRRVGHDVELLQGDWIDHLEKVIDLVRRRAGGERALFILDQCGYSDVPLLAVGEILQRVAKAEVILTFATDYLIDYLSNSYQAGPGIVRAGINVERILSAMDKSKPEWRRLIQLELHKEIQEKTGAKFYTPFFIRSTEANRDLWLVHLSGHYRARDVMVGIHWLQNTSFAHYAKPGLNMFGYDQDDDQFRSSQLWLPGYFFDETARALTHEAIHEQLARQIVDSREAIDVQSIFAVVSNGTPATVQMLRDVLRDLASEGVISIRDETGLTARTKGVRSDKDVIRATGQRLLFG
jgi:three-Cys-motif partner protein